QVEDGPRGGRDAQPVDLDGVDRAPPPRAADPLGQLSVSPAADDEELDLVLRRAIEAVQLCGCFVTDPRQRAERQETDPQTLTPRDRASGNPPDAGSDPFEPPLVHPGRQAVPPHAETVEV